MTDHAQTWRDTLKRAGQLDPTRVAATIVAQADNGLRAARYDSDGGGRTTRVECPENEREHCEEGPEPHSHLVTSDPTGNAAVRTRRDPSADDLRRLERAARDFVTAANGVLWWVCGDTANTWQGIVRINARLMPGTIQAGMDVDDDYRLPPAIQRAAKAVETVSAIASDHLPHAPSVDDQHWTAGLGPNDVCAWHRDVHERYKRPRLAGKNICGDCCAIAELLGQKPPRWLLEAEVDLRESRPVAWRAALSRCMDELGIVRSA